MTVLNDSQCVVVGSGVVGLCCAGLLNQHAKTTRVLGGEAPVWHPQQAYGRVYAINLQVQNMLQALGVWDELLASGRVQSYEAMEVFDGARQQCARQQCPRQQCPRQQCVSPDLRFHSTELGLPTLGFIVEDLLLRKTLFDHLDQCAVELSLHSRLATFKRDGKSIHIGLETGEKIKTDLLIGADGVQSAVRREMQVAVKSVDYRQKAFTATLKLDRAHQNTCRQWFYPDSILALLPLPGACASMVWSCDLPLAAQLESDPAGFLTALNNRLPQAICQVSSMSATRVFPLQGLVVDQYTQPGVALVGDAAHQIHPLAGQGANLGLADVACLVKILAEQGFSYPGLRCYERAVKGRNLGMKLFLEQLQCLMASQHKLTMCLRRSGMAWINRWMSVKTRLMRHALGSEHGALAAWQSTQEAAVAAKYGRGSDAL